MIVARAWSVVERQIILSSLWVWMWESEHTSKAFRSISSSSLRLTAFHPAFGKFPPLQLISAQPEAEGANGGVEEDGNDDGEDVGNLEWFDPDPGKVNKSWRSDLAKARKTRSLL